MKIKSKWDFLLMQEVSTIEKARPGGGGGGHSGTEGGRTLVTYLAEKGVFF